MLHICRLNIDLINRINLFFLHERISVPLIMCLVFILWSLYKCPILHCTASFRVPSDFLNGLTISSDIGAVSLLYNGGFAATLFIFINAVVSIWQFCRLRFHRINRNHNCIQIHFRKSVIIKRPNFKRC